jgi:hypothetical protein
MKKLNLEKFAVLFLLGVHTQAFAADDLKSDIKSTATDIGHTFKQGGKDIGHAVKTGAKEVGHATKRTAHSIAHSNPTSHTKPVPKSSEK